MKAPRNHGRRAAKGVRKNVRYWRWPARPTWPKRLRHGARILKALDDETIAMLIDDCARRPSNTVGCVALRRIYPERFR